MKTYKADIESGDLPSDLMMALEDQFNEALWDAFCKVLADNDVEHDVDRCATMFRRARFDEAIRTSTAIAVKMGDAVNKMIAQLNG